MLKTHIVMSSLRAIYLKWIAIFTVGSACANTIQVNIACGYLYDGFGVTPTHRLPPDTLCVLVADSAGDGFDPLNGDWVSGDDLLVTVFDAEFPLTRGGTKGFDLASGNTETGLFSRSLGIDLAQFKGRSTPLPVALRWFPGTLAANVNLTDTKPATGSPYGEFFRITPLYPSSGSVGWFLPMSAGVSLNFDPFATLEFEGQDPAVNGMANWRVLQDGRAMEPRLVLTGTGFARLSFRGAPSTRYAVYRSLNKTFWEVQASPITDAFGACVWDDSSPLFDRAFYRVGGPLSGD